MFKHKPLFFTTKNTIYKSIQRRKTLATFSKTPF